MGFTVCGTFHGDSTSVSGGRSSTVSLTCAGSYACGSPSVRESGHQLLNSTLINSWGIVRSR